VVATAPDRVAAAAEPERRVWTRRLPLLLGAQTLILVLASVNRLPSATHAQVCRSMLAPVL
jgi:hypothetical protein